MRKNLTVSLTLEDWGTVQAMVRSLNESCSGVFHRLVQSSVGKKVDQKRIKKYRALLAPQADFLARRAHVFATARKHSRLPA